MPWTTSWVGSSNFASVPIAVYGVVLLGATAASWAFRRPSCASRVTTHRSRPRSAATSSGPISPVCYVVGIGCALLHWPFASLALYVAVALLWLVPDRRIEKGFAAVS